MTEMQFLSSFLPTPNHEVLPWFHLGICTIALTCGAEIPAGIIPVTKQPNADDSCNCQLPWNLRSREITVCCEGSELDEVPQNLTTAITKLILRYGSITKIGEDAFRVYPKLNSIYIMHMDELTTVNANAFGHLDSLIKLSITNCRKLVEITGVLLQGNRKLLSLYLDLNNLQHMPKLAMINPRNFPIVDLSHNAIRTITKGDIDRVFLSSLIMEHNALESIEADAFAGSKIGTLKLNHNPHLTFISPRAFQGILNLKTLELSETSIGQLPEVGLKRLQRLIVENTESLKMLPPVLAFSNLNSVVLTYSHHCCFFKHVEVQKNYNEYRDTVEELRKKYCDSARYSGSEAGEVLPQTRIKRQGISWGSFSRNGSRPKANNHLNTLNGFNLKGVFGKPISHNSTIISTFTNRSDICSSLLADQSIHDFYSNISCTPQPNALNPCEDITGYSFLRVLIWIVWLAALFGNIGVLCVLLMTNNRRVKIHNFLVANLAFADVCMGIYLAMLAIEDVRTAGAYYNYAIDWQTGSACKTAGFLTVLSSELSVCTMLVISFDVWYNTRYVFWGRTLSFSVVAWLMAVSWTYSLIMATLPLVGVSGYGATSTCLPLEVATTSDRMFLVFGLLFNSFAFCLICASYINIYCSIACNKSSSPSGVQAQDIMIAKRMAILIGTNFLCWGPIILFASTAAAERPLIDISTSKILLVIFYPINSCANPFLYVFLTKQYRKEVSRVLRKHEILQRWQTCRRARENSQLLTPMTTQSLCSSSTNKTPRSSDTSVLSAVSYRSAWDFPDVPTDNTANGQLIAPAKQEPSNMYRSFNALISRKLSRFKPQMSVIQELSQSNSGADDQSEGFLKTDSASMTPFPSQEKLDKYRITGLTAKPLLNKRLSLSGGEIRKISFMDQLLLKLADETQSDSAFNDDHSDIACICECGREDCPVSQQFKLQQMGVHEEVSNRMFAMRKCPSLNLNSLSELPAEEARDYRLSLLTSKHEVPEIICDSHF